MSIVLVKMSERPVAKDVGLYMTSGHNGQDFNMTSAKLSTLPEVKMSDQFERCLHINKQTGQNAFMTSGQHHFFS